MPLIDTNDRAAIIAALEGGDPNSPVAVAIAQKLDALSKILEHACAETGGFPEVIRIKEPITALDELVVGIFRATLREKCNEIAQQYCKHPDEIGFPDIQITDGKVW